MYCEFYLDVFFAVNLLLDFQLLCLTNLMLWGTANPLRAFWGGILGAAGMCLFMVLSPKIHTGEAVMYYGIMAVVMIRTGCGCRNPGNLFLGLLTFFGGALLTGGVLTALPYGIRKSLLLFLTITVTAYWILYIGIRLCKYLKRKRELFCEVRIVLNRKEIKVKGLYDTGNCLYDRATGKAVCVIEKDSFFQLLTEKQQQFLESFCIMEMAEEKEAEEEAVFFRGLNPRFLPYTSVGCQKGLLPVVTVDRIIVREQEEERKIQRAAVGISYTKMSEKGRFQAIISPEVWEK